MEALLIYFAVLQIYSLSIPLCLGIQYLAILLSVLPCLIRLLPGLECLEWLLKCSWTALSDRASRVVYDIIITDLVRVCVIVIIQLYTKSVNGNTYFKLTHGHIQ